MGVARVGVAGEIRGRTAAVPQAAVGMAGLDRPQFVDIAKMAALGNASTNHNGGEQADLTDVVAMRERDQGLARLSKGSTRLGDRSTSSWHRGILFSDFTYLVKGDGNGGVTWRQGREDTFGEHQRILPLYVDSSGYRREITQTAPLWARQPDLYPAAIELTKPDGYAAWDYPDDRQKSLDALSELMRIFPHHVGDKMWPVFSIRWVWRDDAHLALSQAPGWMGNDLAKLIPLNKTQRRVKNETQERMARLAVANALIMAHDPDFREMIDLFGRVMIGGLIGSGCSRIARHLVAAVLCHLFPGVQFWLLGQANFAVVNGLGWLGLLDQTWTDGTWWLKDATAERFATVQDGLITMYSFEAPKPLNGGRRQKRQESFFTYVELAAANLRSLMAAYAGQWTWPRPTPIPLDLGDIEQVRKLRRCFQRAQLELGW